MILEPGERLERLRRITNHPAIRCDKGDAGAEQLADTTGFSMQRPSRTGRLRALAQELGGEARFRHERLFDASFGLRPHRRGENPAGDRERNRGGRHRDEEQLDLEAGAYRHGRLVRRLTNPRAALREACSRIA